MLIGYYFPSCSSPDEFTVRIVARDQGPVPRESQEATVTVSVTKNRYAPVARIEPSTITIGKQSTKLTNSFCKIYNNKLFCQW